MNPVMKRLLELEIKTLQDAPRDEDKLERLLRVKEWTVQERQRWKCGDLEKDPLLIFSSIVAATSLIYSQITTKLLYEPVSFNLWVYLMLGGCCFFGEDLGKQPTL